MNNEDLQTVHFAERVIDKKQNVTAGRVPKERFVIEINKNKNPFLRSVIEKYCGCKSATYMFYDDKSIDKVIEWKKAISAVKEALNHLRAVIKK